jgi:TPR repeat protein
MSPMGEAEAYGVQPDSVAALRWLEAAAQQEHGDAMTLVAYAYELGLGTEVNPATAARWWRRLAERGDADAMHRLGTIARIGRMLPQAAHWFRAAAARGDMLALRYLRELAAEGVAEAALDPAEELAMLEAAAAAGDVVAIETLELRYAAGEGVRRDPARALPLLRRAVAEERAKDRSGPAAEALARLEAELAAPAAA